MDAAKKRGIEVIPFSVQNPKNEKTEYTKYFAKPRAKQVMYADTKKTLSNYWGMFRATVWNYDAEKQLRRLIRDTKPDVVYVLHEINHLSPSIIRAAKKENVRVVHRISDFFMFCAKYDFLCGEEICEACIRGDYNKAIANRCVKGSKMGTWLRIFAMKLYKKMDIFSEVNHFVATCQFSRDKLIEGGVPKDKITCIPTFIDANVIEPCYEHEKYFLFLGRMAKQKGTIYAIEAMKYIRDTDYVLKITGTISEDEEDQKIWKYIVDNKLEDKVIFTGFLHGQELENLIKKATAIVCPAIWYENMPNTVIEAYAYGKPVIASRLGSFPNIIDDSITGFLFEAKNSKDMAERMIKFCNDIDLSVKMGHNARIKCETEFSEEMHMKRLVEVLAG